MPDEVESPAEPLKEGEDPRHPGDEGPEEGLGISKDPEASYQEEVKRLKGEVDELRATLTAREEALKRVSADFDNFRKRVEREREQDRSRAAEGVLQSFLDVAANFDRAIEAAGGDEAAHEGITLIYKQFRDVLRKEGVDRVDTTGHPFDPRFHEAVMREETSAYEDGTILQEFEPGWTLHGRVIRAAKVKVSARPVADEAADEDADDNEGDPAA